jgi:hypothetical protein
MTQNINEIACALAKAQVEMNNPSFDAQNPHFRNRYASLAAVRNAVVPPLARNGIACLQDLRAVESGISCETLLVHSSGQQMSFGPLVLPVSKADAQGFGSAATYARRYQLMAVAGVVGDADDDAEAAVTSHNGHGTVANHKQNNVKAKEYADRFAEAVQSGIDGAVYDIHQEIVSDEEFYRQVWSFLPSGMRRQLKEIIERQKAAA